MTMTIDERVEGVRTRLARSPRLAQAVRDAVVRGDVPDAAAAVIPDEAREAVATDRQPLESLVRIDALEAIVRRVGRPPLLIRNDAVELQDLVDFPPETGGLITGIHPWIPSVGRVEFLNHRMSWGGTGWVVDGDGDARVVATNRHVAKLVARRTATGRGVFLRSPSSGVLYGMNVDFKEEVGARPEDARAVAVREILYLADDAAPDVALLRIVGAGLPDPLDLADDEAQEEDVVALIGYPAFDSRNDANDQARYFHDLYDVKRCAPGFVMQALSGRTVLTHDCTSLGGNSGSPLIDLRSRRVVGLHYAGVYGVENSAVGIGSLKRALAGAERVVIPVPRRPQGAEIEARDGFSEPGRFRGRGGYDLDFLGDGLAAPWPGLPAHVLDDLARPSDGTAADPFQLRYTHFGVRFSTSRRQPVVTAVNIDGEHPVRIKRGKDKWFTDGRLGRDVQLGRDDYDDPEIDRGHMVRREDPNWGPDAAQANDDTFHYTNAAVQHATMNQGKELWLGLENYILDNARTHGFRACVFTGPVNRDDDPEIKDGVLAPREFWKLVAMAGTDGTLHATAYLLSQGDLIRELLEKRDRTEAKEGFELGAYRTFQIAIRDLADATGYDLSAYVAADPLSRSVPADESVDGAPVYVALDSLTDVVV
ncbi:DNA/RNA non-specific endonuclease [Geodermatophilus sp. URMC 61]|uniref:DNA/RNA non-specific endonuclease n=1 Tax=Geodermatophilus sp. URMC 61 TaxID=3423411 RepID=UPI00406BE9BF